MRSVADRMKRAGWKFVQGVLVLLSQGAVGVMPCCSGFQESLRRCQELSDKANPPRSASPLNSHTWKPFERPGLETESNTLEMTDCLQYPAKTAHGLGFLSPQLLQTIRTLGSTFVSGLGDVLTGPRGKTGQMHDGEKKENMEAHRCAVTGRHGAGGSPLMLTPPIHPWGPECTADEISQVWTGLEPPWIR
ncbi:hypothetical protein DPX16_7836 [Anabarilius grahami]|uniref:Uncharacterized protein n=1 Tax=Anabarilius grahami TaxID=495550 RepID=A0A3N0XJV3_ANAGA|nr:hypothetical protein DPX16_7836 [Anabarilius grahami]